MNPIIEDVYKQLKKKWRKNSENKSTSNYININNRNIKFCNISKHCTSSRKSTDNYIHKRKL